MSASFKTPIRRAVRGNLSRGLLGAMAVALLPLAALAADPVDYTPDYTKLMGHDHDDHHGAQDSALVKKGFEATKKYTHFAAVTAAEGWDMKTTCVSSDETTSISPGWAWPPGALSSNAPVTCPTIESSNPMALS